MDNTITDVEINHQDGKMNKAKVGGIGSKYGSTFVWVAIVGVILIITAGIAMSATTMLNNDAPAQIITASEEDFLVMDFNLTVGSDTTINGTAPPGGTAINATEDPDWNGSATTDFYFYDKTTGGAWDVDNDWMGFDLDGDEVYTSAADTLVDANGAASDAGTTLVTVRATLYDIVPGDLVVSNSLTEPAKVWRDVINNTKYTGAQSSGTVGGTDGDTGTTLETLTNATVSGANGAYAAGEGVYVSDNVTLDTGDTIVKGETLETLTDGKVSGVDGVWAGDTSEGVWVDGGSVPGYVDATDTHITTETLTPLSVAGMTTIYATSLTGIGIGDTLNIATTVTVSGAVSAVSGNTITIASTGYDEDPANISAAITVAAGGTLDTDQALGGATVDADGAGTLISVEGIAIGDVLKILEDVGGGFWEGTVATIDEGTPALTWTGATQTGEYTPGASTLSITTPASPNGKVTTPIQTLTNATVTASGVGANVYNAGEGVFVSTNTTYDTTDTIIVGTTIQTLTYGKVTILGSANGVLDATNESVYDDVDSSASNVVSAGDYRLTSITAETSVRGSPSDNDTGTNVAATAGWVKENSGTWAVGDDIFIESYAGALTYSTAADTKIGGTTAPDAGTEIKDAKDSDWTTVKFYDNSTGGVDWDNSTDWVGIDADGNDYYLDKITAMTVDMSADGGQINAGTDTTNVKFWLDNGSSTFETAGDTVIGTASSYSVGGSGWYISGLSRELAAGTNRIFVSMTLNGGASNDEAVRVITPFSSDAGSDRVFQDGDRGIFLSSKVFGNIVNAYSMTVDAIAPTVTIASTASDPTKTSPIPMTVTFSESVTEFVEGDIAVVNGTIANFAGSGAAYTFNIIATGEVAVTANIAADVANDTAGNNNTAAPEFSIDFDDVVPTVALASTASDPTKTSPIPMTVTFSESVTEFVEGDIAVVNGTIANFAGSGAAYTFNIIATGEVAVTANIAADVANDTAGNNNTAAPEFSIDFDDVVPTVALASTASDPTKTSPIPMTVTFSESVTEFVEGDIAVVNGTIANFAGSGAAYTFNIIATGEVAVTANIAADVANDTAGNNNTAAPEFSIDFDDVVPTVALASTASDPTKTSPIPMTVTFSESVTEFVEGDIAVVNGTIANFAGSGAAYTFNIIATGEVAVTANIAADVANDTAGNNNTAAPEFSIDFDDVVPTVALASTASDPTKTSPIPMTVTFSESVTEFVEGDIAVVNGTIANFAGSGAAYTFNIIATGEVAVTANIAADVANDTAGNNNTAAPEFSIDFDDVVPTVALASTASDPTKTSPIPMTVTFSESVTEFVEGDIAVVNGTIANFAGSGAAYTFNIIATGEVAVTANIAADVANDTAGNNNTAAPEFSIDFDDVVPTVALASTASDPTKTSPIPMTVTFSESVTEFVEGDIAVVNGTIANFAGSGAAYTFNIIATGEVAVTANIAADVANDTAGNNNTAAPEFSIDFDDVVPTVALASTASDPTKTSPIPMTVTFSESVTEFVEGDIAVVNGTIANFAGSGAAYTFNIIATGEVAVTANIAADVANDTAGNNNTAAPEFSIDFDDVVPTVALASTASDPTKTSPIPMTVTFSESVTEFVEGDIAVVNGTIANFAGSGAAYTFNIIATGEVAVTANIAADVANDTAGNNNTAAPEFSIDFDDVVPTVALASTASDPTKTSPIPMTVTFSESVTEFVEGDIAVVNGTIANFAGSGAAYTFNIIATGEVAVTANIAADVANDTAGNNNTAAPEFSIDFDDVVPTVALASTASDPTKTSPIPMTVTFSESVTEFVEGDIAVVNGTIANFAGSGAAYTFNIIATGEVAVTANIAADVANDTAGNNNTAAPEFSIDFDDVVPTVALASTASDPTKTSPIPMTVTFSESVTEFVEGDIAVVNGTIANFAGSGAAYTFNIIATGEVAVTANIAADVANDTAGNNNTAAPEFSIDFDDVVPTVALASTASDPTKTSPIPMTVTFSESVTEFVEGDIAVVNGTIANFAGSGAAYTFNIIATGEVAVTANIAADVANDTAGNNNTAAPEFSIDFDDVVPTVALASTASDPTKTSPIPMTVTFSESVTEFVEGDIAVVNGTIANFAGSGAAYTFNIIATGEVAVTANIAADVANDTAGNNNTAAPEFSIDFDDVVPTVALASTASDPTKTSPIPMTVTFSESVTEFVEGDIAVVNGTIANFAGSGAAYTFNIIATGEVAVTANIAADVANDTAGNNNTAAPEFSIDFDDVVPTVALASTASDPTKTSPIPMTVTFSESVTEFVEGDIAVVNGTIANFAGSGAAYTFNIIATGEVAVTANIAADVANDTAGNNNTAAPEFSIDFDDVVPTVALASTASDPTKTSPIPMTVTFSESVTEFVEGDIAVVNGTIANFAGSGAAYTFNIIATGEVAVTANIAADVANDTAGNNNTAAPEFSIDFDDVVPTVALASTASDPTKTSPIPMTVTFSESVTEFVEGDIAVVNGTIANFAGSGAAYTFNIIATGEVAVTANIAADVANDTAGNNNTAAPEFSIDFDDVVPTVALASTASDPTKTSPIPMTVTFSESVTEFVEGDIAVVNGTIANFAGSGAAYTFNIIATGEVAVTANIAADVANDTAGNNNTAAPEFSIDFDDVVPTVALASTASDPTKTSPIPMTVTFSESVTEFVEGDIAVVNGTIANFAGSGAAYTFNIIATGEVAVTANIAADVANDTAGNNNTAAPEFSIDFDDVVPTVDAGPDQIGINVGATVTFNGSGSSDAGSGIASYSWNFGDGNSSTGVAPTHAYGTGDMYTVTLTVTDNASNTNTDTMSVAVAVKSYSISLNTGWNLVSTPLMPTNTSVESVLSDMNYVVEVHAYDALNGWVQYTPGYGQYATLTDITAGTGYWFQMNASETLTINGTFLGPGGATPPTYPVYTGWNLIGFHSLSADIPYDYLSNVREDYASKMYGYKNGAWVTVNNADVSGGTDELEPGYGYWLYMQLNGTIVP